MCRCLDMRSAQDPIYVIYCWWRTKVNGPGPFHERYPHRNSNSLDISSYLHLSCIEVIAMAFCTRHDSSVVAAYVIFSSGLILYSWITRNWFSIKFELRWRNRLRKAPYPCLWKLTLVFNPSVTEWNIHVKMSYLACFCNMFVNLILSVIFTVFNKLNIYCTCYEMDPINNFFDLTTFFDIPAKFHNYCTNVAMHIHCQPW